MIGLIYGRQVTGLLHQEGSWSGRVREQFIQPMLVIASSIQSDINIITVAQELLLRTVL